MNSHIENSDDSFVEVLSGLVDHIAPSPPVTPKSERLPGAFSFDHVSSDNDSDSSYSELDSEAEAFYSSLNHNLVLSPGELDFPEKQVSYEELMKRFVECEEELKTTTLKLQASEQVIVMLKGENEKRNMIAEELSAELLMTRMVIESRDEEIESEKKRVLELQRQFVDLESKFSDWSLKSEKLTNELEVSKECLAGLNAEIAGLLETGTRCEVLEGKIRHSDAEKLEMERREFQLLGEINALEKDLDEQKMRCGFLMAEKDGFSAELDSLKKIELVSKNTVEEELRGVVKELEKRVELQRNVITEVEEEKREVIRQLCFSLDHYKTGYRQLLQLNSRDKKQ